MLVTIEVGPVLLSLLRTAIGAYLVSECVRAAWIITVCLINDKDEPEETEGDPGAVV